MLVIERKEGDGIQIETFEVRVLKIRNGRVKIGIIAPAELKIVRSELLEKP